MPRGYDGRAVARHCVRIFSQSTARCYDGLQVQLFIVCALDCLIKLRSTSGWWFGAGTLQRVKPVTSKHPLRWGYDPWDTALSHANPSRKSSAPPEELVPASYLDWYSFDSCDNFFPRHKSPPSACIPLWTEIPESRIMTTCIPTPHAKSRIRLLPFIHPNPNLHDCLTSAAGLDDTSSKRSDLETMHCADHDGDAVPR